MYFQPKEEIALHYGNSHEILWGSSKTRGENVGGTKGDRRKMEEKIVRFSAVEIPGNDKLVRPLFDPVSLANNYGTGVRSKFMAPCPVYCTCTC